MEAKEFLKQIHKLDLMLENKLVEKEQWQAIAEGLNSGGMTVLINGVAHNMDKVQSQSNPQKMADAVIKLMEIEEEIKHCIEELHKKKSEVIKVIEMLEAIEYDFIHKIYVQHLTLSEVAYKCKYSYSWATTMHQRAIESVQKILDQKGEIKNDRTS